MSASKPNANKLRAQGVNEIISNEHVVSVACRIPEDTRRQFHAACVYRGKTMNAVLISYIMKCIKATKSSSLLLLLSVMATQANAQISPLFQGMSGPDQTQATPAPDNSTSPTMPNMPDMPDMPDMPSSNGSVSTPDGASFGMDQVMGVEEPVPMNMNDQLQDNVSPVGQDPVILPPPFPPSEEPVTALPLMPESPTQNPGMSPVTSPVPATAPAPATAPIVAKQIPDVKPLEAHTVTVDVEKLELGKISRTISSVELKKMDYELVATEKTKPINLVLGNEQVKLEVPIIGYLLKERKITPSPLAVPVASVDAGYRFSDTDMRNLKIMYNSMLEKANVNATTAERFREVLKSMEDYIRGLDAKKQASSEM